MVHISKLAIGKQNWCDITWIKIRSASHVSYLSLPNRAQQISLWKEKFIFAFPNVYMHIREVYIKHFPTIISGATENVKANRVAAHKQVKSLFQCMWCRSSQHFHLPILSSCYYKKYPRSEWTVLQRPLHFLSEGGSRSHPLLEDEG